VPRRHGGEFPALVLGQHRLAGDVRGGALAAGDLGQVHVVHVEGGRLLARLHHLQGARDDGAGGACHTATQTRSNQPFLAPSWNFPPFLAKPRSDSGTVQ